MALALGRTVKELENTMSSREFTRWMAFYRLEPFGSWRDNYHAATIASLLQNIHRARNSEPSSIGDFMYRDSQTIQEDKTKSFLARLDALAKHG